MLLLFFIDNINYIIKKIINISNNFTINIINTLLKNK